MHTLFINIGKSLCHLGLENAYTCSKKNNIGKSRKLQNFIWDEVAFTCTVTLFSPSLVAGNVNESNMQYNYKAKNVNTNTVWSDCSELDYNISSLLFANGKIAYCKCKLFPIHDNLIKYHGQQALSACALFTGNMQLTCSCSELVCHVNELNMHYKAKNVNTNNV